MEEQALGLFLSSVEVLNILRKFDHSFFTTKNVSVKCAFPVANTFLSFRLDIDVTLMIKLIRHSYSESASAYCQ